MKKLRPRAASRSSRKKSKSPSVRMSSPDAAVVLCTVPNVEAAEKLAHTLVAEGLVACVNLVPQVRSVYRWEGRVCDEAEVLLVIKTRASAFKRVEARVKALHSYSVPEIIRLDVAAGHAPYLEWLVAATGG